MTLTFRCPPGLETIIPQPIPAVLGLPDWFKALPPKTFNATMGEETQTVKKCPPFIDAMTYGFLIPLAVDLKVQDGEFSWDFEPPTGLASEYPHSPVGFHDPSQVAGTPFFEDDRFIIKFNNFWTIETPPGYSLLCTHPVNRTDLPFTTLTGLVDCDTFYDTPLNFPARWHDAEFQRRAAEGHAGGAMSAGEARKLGSAISPRCPPRKLRDHQDARCARREPDIYRRQFRAPKR